MAPKAGQNTLLRNVSNQQVILISAKVIFGKIQSLNYSINSRSLRYLPNQHLYLMHQANFPVKSVIRRFNSFRQEIQHFSFASAFLLLGGTAIFSACANDNANAAGMQNKTILADGKSDTAENPAAATIDTALYNEISVRLANGDTSGRWPVKGPYPKAGALLPFRS